MIVYSNKLLQEIISQSILNVDSRFLWRTKCCKSNKYKLC